MRAMLLTGVLAEAFIATATSQSIPQDTGAAGTWQNSESPYDGSVLHGTASGRREWGDLSGNTHGGARGGSRGVCGGMRHGTFVQQRPRW